MSEFEKNVLNLLNKIWYGVLFIIGYNILIHIMV